MAQCRDDRVSRTSRNREGIDPTGSVVHGSQQILVPLLRANKWPDEIHGNTVPGIYAQQRMKRKDGRRLTRLELAGNASPDFILYDLHQVWHPNPPPDRLVYHRTPQMSQVDVGLPNELADLVF
jgi:hypothetical protein